MAAAPQCLPTRTPAPLPPQTQHNVASTLTKHPHCPARSLSPSYFHLPLDLAVLKAVPNTVGAVAPPASANGGLVAALDAYTGDVQWAFTNPALQNGDATKNALSQSPVTVANGARRRFGAGKKGPRSTCAQPAGCPAARSGSPAAPD